MELRVKSTETPANHLDPDVREVVAKLSDDETSQIFTAQGIRVMVHLVKRTPEAPIPLEKVKESIRSTIFKEKVNRMLTDYLDKVKSGSKIEIREKQWKAIQKELGGL